MFRKILIYTAYVLSTAALVAYFFFSTILYSKQIESVKCREIKVVILDSAKNRFVGEEEIIELLRIEGITPDQSKIIHVNQYHLENIINKRTAVKRSHVSVTPGGLVKVEIEQLRPILRIEGVNGGFYMDESGGVFPLMRSFTSYVPVITGDIPLKVTPGYKGEVKENREWAEMIYQMGIFLAENPKWNLMIEQIDVDKTGVLWLIPRKGDFDIIFGQPDNIHYKFQKLLAFYQNVLPETGWEAYKSVDLRFGNQLVCKKREINN